MRLRTADYLISRNLVSCLRHTSAAMQKTSSDFKLQSHRTQVPEPSPISQTLFRQPLEQYSRDGRLLQDRRPKHWIALGRASCTHYHPSTSDLPRSGHRNLARRYAPSEHLLTILHSCQSQPLQPSSPAARRSWEARSKISNKGHRSMPRIKMRRNTYSMFRHSLCRPTRELSLDCVWLITLCRDFIKEAEKEDNKQGQGH